MTEFILDASVALSWCFADETTAESSQLLDSLEQSTAIVPGIWPLEIGNILLSAQRKKRISYADMIQFIEMFSDLNIEIDSETTDKSFHEILSLAYTEKLTSYDAAYLELAIRLGLPLATKDKELRQAGIRLGISVLQV